MINKPRIRSIDTTLQALERVIQDIEGELEQSVNLGYSVPMERLISEGMDVIKRFYPSIEKVIKEHGTTVRSIWADSTKKIKEKPWTFLGAVALGGLGAGLILGSLCKHLPPGDAK